MNLKSYFNLALKYLPPQKDTSFLRLPVYKFIGKGFVPNCPVPLINLFFEIELG